MKERREIPLKLLTQGAVRVNNAWTEYESDGAIAIAVDLHSKYCELEASCGHQLLLGADEHSLHLQDGVDRNAITHIELELPPGNWSLFTGRVSRYTAYVVYLRDRNN